MKKRLQLAHALVHEPDILILDEPSAGVDLELKEEIYYILADLHKKGVTIILTSHYIEELGRLCNRVVFIKNGQIQNSYINNTNGEKEIERIYRKLYIKNGA